MKLEFTHTGNVHELLMGLLGGSSVTLTNQAKKTLQVEPRFTREGTAEGFKLTRGSKMTMTIPVTIKDFNAPALMTFEYGIGHEKVAEAVPTVEAVNARPAQDDLPAQEARPAIEGHPAVIMEVFRSTGFGSGLLLKFE